jgi:hypothetical protein
MAQVIDQQATDQWALYQSDCVEGLGGLADESIHFTIFSPPFASLYTYSASDRDMGNCRDEEEFSEHFGYLIEEMLRVTMPGRLVSVHCMNLPLLKQKHGVIGLQDFRGEIIRLFSDVGWIYHSEVAIWKDPVIAMQRTKALGLLHKQIVKDSCMSRMGIPDYVCTFRKPGDNPEPVEGELDRWVGDNGALKRTGRLSTDIWQRYASPIWDDINPSNTLQYTTARDGKDERHICPLQLEVIERCVQLWSNPGDTVLDPFAGIGSTGHVAIGAGRRFVGFELKESYFKVATKNMRAAEKTMQEQRLF